MKKVLMMLALFCIVVGVGTADAKRSTDYRNALVFAYSPVSSVYEDDNIKLEIYDEQLWATNKTKRTIFIDRSQCFLINNGCSYPMWGKEHGDEAKASKYNEASSVEEFLAIAPSAGDRNNVTFVCNLAGFVFGEYTTSETPSGTFTDYERRLLTLIDEMVTESKNADKKGKKYVGSVSRHLTEDESISNIGASLAYAFSKRSEEWTPVQVSTWVSDVIFTPYYVKMPKDLSKKEKRGFGVKESKPAEVHIMSEQPFEFPEDRSPLVMCDWTGDYKKGTFTLATVKIAKHKGKKIGLGILAAMLAGPQAAERFFKPSYDVYYKNIAVFDGSDADWGKMSYVDDIMKTKQSD